MTFIELFIPFISKKCTLYSAVNRFEQFYLSFLLTQNICFMLAPFFSDFLTASVLVIYSSASTKNRFCFTEWAVFPCKIYNNNFIDKINKRVNE